MPNDFNNAVKSIIGWVVVASILIIVLVILALV